MHLNQLVQCPFPLPFGVCFSFGEVQLKWDAFRLLLATDRLYNSDYKMMAHVLNNLSCDLLFLIDGWWQN